MMRVAYSCSMDVFCFTSMKHKASVNYKPVSVTQAASLPYLIPYTGIFLCLSGNTNIHYILHNALAII